MLDGLVISFINLNFNSLDQVSEVLKANARNVKDLYGINLSASGNSRYQQFRVLYNQVPVVDMLYD